MRVLQVTTNVRHVARLVAIVALTILEDNDVSTIIPIKLTEDIVHVESPIVSIGRHLDWVLGLGEVLNQLLGHDNLGLEGLILLLELLLAGDVIDRLFNLLAHLRALLDPFSLGLEPLPLLFLALGLLIGLFAPLFLLKGLALLAQLLLILEIFGLLEQSGPLNLILLLQEPLFSLFLLLGKLSLFFLHGLTLESLPLDALLSLAGLPRLSLLLLLGDCT